MKHHRPVWSLLELMRVPWAEPMKLKFPTITVIIKLQDHGNPMRFRNIWIRPLGEVK